MNQHTKLFVDDGGEGNIPVVFLHSGGASSTQMSAQVAHVRRSRRALAFDMRGHGRSPMPADGNFSIEALAGDVIAELDHLGIQKFVLVGHSTGGAVAVSIAGTIPERVVGLFLLDPAADGRALPKHMTGPMLEAMRTDKYSEVTEGYWQPMIAPSKPEIQERLLSDLRATRPETVTGVLAALLEFDPVTPLHRYAGKPQLSLVTQFNGTPNAYHAQVKTLPHVAIEGVGHWLHIDKPELINEHLDRFLSRL